VTVVDYETIRNAGSLSDRAKLCFHALIVVTAARAGAVVLYSEDLNDGDEILGVRINNPFRA
jgi:predicted nucleic acid-binding protein